MVFETPGRQASFLSLKLAGVWGLRPHAGVQGARPPGLFPYFRFTVRRTPMLMASTTSMTRKAAA